MSDEVYNLVAALLCVGTLVCLLLWVWWLKTHPGRVELNKETNTALNVARSTLLDEPEELAWWDEQMRRAGIERYPLSGNYRIGE